MSEMIYRNLGKDTLGDGDKMKVGMHVYERSTHDKSFAWRSTMGVGTCVPALKLLGLPGDTFEIDIDSKIFTNPTVGPLFGQYKLQIDVFSCPLRLYIAQLHNNANDVAEDMTVVKLPTAQVKVLPSDNPTKDNKFKAINPSSILAYLGQRGYEYVTEREGAMRTFNATPLVAYWDIMNNYYINKQEKKYYSITYNNNSYTVRRKLTYGSADNEPIEGSEISLTGITQDDATKGNFTLVTRYGDEIQGSRFIQSWGQEWSNGTATFTLRAQEPALFTRGNEPVNAYKGTEERRIELKAWDIETLNGIREELLSKGKAQMVYTAGQKNPIEDILSDIGTTLNSAKKSSQPQTGLCIKTYQADMYTNFINTERVKKLTEKTRVSTTGNSFTIDALNLSQKLYNIGNRMAASDGTYKDWIEIGYTTNYGLRTETPIYEGGMSDMIVFEEVVNTAQSENNPLGELGGRGRTAGQKKGGRLRINVDEPSYIIGIVSITPLVDYSEGNDFDMTLDNMGQLHIPGLDGIGYEDIKTSQVAYWAKKDAAYAKTTAWQNYMTNVNKVYGNFAIPGDMAHMVLNRYFDTEKYANSEANTSSYINPEAYNYIFAKQGLDALNFQVQIGWGIEARRKMGARQIPKI